jgi:hypothetical protein
VQTFWNGALICRHLRRLPPSGSESQANGIRFIALISLRITIPVNTAVTVCVPARDEASVTESGGPAEKPKGVKFLRMEDNTAVYAVGSGTYRFQSSLPDAVK